MIKELKSIREELLTGVEDGDMLFIEMQINRLDTIIYNLVKNGETVKREQFLCISKFECWRNIDGYCTYNGKCVSQKTD